MASLAPSGFVLAPTQRVSDADREMAARALHGHYAEGRLEVHELEERLEKAWRARTRRDLAASLRDLPARRGQAVLERVDSFQRRVLKVHAAGYAGVNGSLVALWSVTGSGHFWPAFVLAPGTALLGWHAGGSYLVSKAVSRRRTS